MTHPAPALPKPLCIDLYCGLGGWSEGFLSEGYRVVGFDIERHRYPKRNMDSGPIKQGGSGAIWFDKAVDERRRAVPFSGEWDEYPAQLVLQDVLTLHGSQFRNAACIVASPPCQAYSYRAMPWKRAKALPPPDNSLFDACFRIQREASEAAGHHIPMVVENVKGAQPWVGRARWHYGSYYLWGDVPALMVIPAMQRPKFILDDIKNKQRRDIVGVYENGLKCGGDWFGPGIKSAMREHSSKSPARKAASALIAKIPFPLAQHIARVYKPQRPEGE